jgi:hypothetical protein
LRWKRKEDSKKVDYAPGSDRPETTRRLSGCQKVGSRASRDNAGKGEHSSKEALSNETTTTARFETMQSLLHAKPVDFVVTSVRA